jgi:hypothetical protein
MYVEYSYMKKVEAAMVNNSYQQNEQTPLT